jgi:hypothetical protein
LIYLKDAPFYKALCWAIKKYTKEKLPNLSTEIYNLDRSKDINRMVTWNTTPNGQKYWNELHDMFMTIYKRECYFQLMIQDFKENKNLQLDFENLYPKI